MASGSIKNNSHNSHNSHLKQFFLFPILPKGVSRIVTQLTWSTLQFGKHKGKTLPHVVLSDPDWFFWAVGNGIFREPLVEEAQDIARKATHIKIPRPDPENWRLKYQFTYDDKFLDLIIVPVTTTPIESSHAMIGTYLDLSLIHRLQKYDKFGYRILLDKFREYFLNGPKLTKEICENFFHDERNFV